MKFLKLLHITFLLIFFPLLIKAQPTQFNINEYKQFLQSHQNMVTIGIARNASRGYYLEADLNFDYQRCSLL